MADFINEVEEELRKDEYNKLLKRWGPYILGIIIAIIAVAGYIEWQKASADKAARATSAAFVSATNLAAEGERDRAYAEYMAVADKAPGGYAGLSLTQAATIRLNDGFPDEAVSLLDRAAQKFTAERHIQLAQLKAAYILAGEGRYEDVAARVAPLAQKDQPFEYLARELAGFAAMEMGDLSKARQEFSYLETIPGIPEPIQTRAKQNLALMKVAGGATLTEPTTSNDKTETAPEGEEPNNE